MGSVGIPPEVPPEDPMIRWRNYQHLIWSQQQIHLQIQQQQILQQHEHENTAQPTTPPNSNEKNEQNVVAPTQPLPPPLSPQQKLPITGDRIGEGAKDMADSWEQVNAQAAFLGPTLWDRRVPYDGHDFKLEYVDLEEFLTENGIPVNEHGKQLPPRGQSPPSLRYSSPEPPSPVSSFPVPPPFYPPPHGPGGYSLPHRENGSVEDYPSDSQSPSPSTTSTMSQDMNDSNSTPYAPSVPGNEFDPRIRMFSTDELKPQPMIKKSKKQYVPDNAKDAKYWMRRRKNNMAAKRSRDARRVKENQIAMRACYLEKENQFIKKELERIQEENLLLKEQLTRFKHNDPHGR